MNASLPSGCSLAFIQGLGRALESESLARLEKRALECYASGRLITCLMCTTNPTCHNSPATEATLEAGGWEKIASYKSNYVHPGDVNIWIKRLKTG